MRQTHRTTPWAAYQFLRSALERQARRLRLQHWILLAIRTAILLLIALAAAKPFFESNLLNGGNIPTHRFLVIDNSLSMGFTESESLTRFDLATDAAQKLIQQSLTDDKFTILTASNLNEGSSLGIGLDKLAAKNVIKEISLAHCKSNIDLALQTLEGLLAAQDSTSLLPKNTEVVFFTDLLASDWHDFKEDGTVQKDQSLTKIAELARVRLIDVGSQLAENYAVTSLKCQNRLPTTNQTLEFIATVNRFGINESKQITAELIVDGLSVDQQKGIAAQKSTEFAFNTKFDTPGPHTVTVRIADDSLKADNERHLAINLQDSLRVLCIEGRPRAAQHVTDAINPAQKETSPLQPEIISHADLSSMDLNQFDCVIFCNVPEFSDNEKLQIKQYCLLGGGVIFFLGDQVIPERYEGLFIQHSPQIGQLENVSIRPVSFVVEDRLDSKPLIPISIENLIRTSSSRIDPLGYRHPIIAPFEGNEQAGLLSTPISIIHALSLASNSEEYGTQVAMTNVSGDPLLITSRFGAGQIAVMATDGSLQSVDPESGEPWTVMPAWPSFLPLVHGMLQSVLNLDDQIGSYEVGQAMLAPVRYSLSIVRPDQSKELLPTSPKNAIEYLSTDKIGYYDFIDSSETIIQRRAVNSNPIESDTLRSLPSSLDSRLTVVSHESVSIDDFDSGMGEKSIHRRLLLLALFLVLIESGLACWFGQGRA